MKTVKKIKDRIERLKTELALIELNYNNGYYTKKHRNELRLITETQIRELEWIIF